MKGIEDTVFNDLKSLSSNMVKSLYLLAFEKYEGFENFNIENN